MHRGRKKVANPETARRILTAAERIFAMRGMAGARTEEIARAARVNKAMLYYYFGSKRKLHRAVFDNLFRRMHDLIAAATSSQSSPRERLLGFVDGYFQFRASHPNYARLAQRMMMETPEEVRWLAREYFRPAHKRLCGLIKEGMARSEFRQVDAGHTVLCIIAMIVFYFAGAPVQSEILQRDTLEPHAVAEHKRAVLDLLEHGLFRAPARPQ